MRIGAFELPDPVPTLREPHALVMIRPWVDVGSVGTLTLQRLERHFHARELGRLARPGTFFDFTRYRPTTKFVNGDRQLTLPNSVVNYAQVENGPDLLFLHLLEPHAMAEDYVDSVVDLLKNFQISVYGRLGAMYDSVPHTRPIVVTGNSGDVEPRAGVSSPLIQQRQSRYEGPTTILGTIADATAKLGIGSMNFMVHLPHYAQLDEDHAGTARLIEVLSAYYDVPASLAPVRRGRRQYAELDAAVDRQPEVKALIARLEASYDSTYPSAKPEQGEEPPALAPEIERFLKDLDLGS
jgi:PAC2 family protein